MTPPQTIHWVFLIYCVCIALFGGVGNIVSGTSPEDRFHQIDRIVVPVLGVGLLVFSLSVFWRRDWAFYGLIACFGLSLVEALLTFRPPPGKVVIPFPVFAAFIFGVPVVLLVWLRPIFTTPLA